MQPLILLLALFALSTAFGQTIQVPSPKQGRPGEVLPWTRFRPRTDSYTPALEETQKIQAKIAQLGVMIQDLQSRHVDDGLLADVEIFHEAAKWILQFPEEFFRPES